MYEFNPELISRMKTVAKEHTLFVGTEQSGIPNSPCLWEKIQYNNEEINLILTYEVLEQKPNVKAWHLSILKTDESEINQQMADEIAFDILGEQTKEIPAELFAPEFRFAKQFILQDF